MNVKKNTVLTGIILFVILAGGLIAGLLLVGRQQLFQQKASVAGGTAKAYLSPETKSLTAGESFPAKVYFDTAGTPVSALMVQLEYSYSGSEPPVSVTSIDLNQTLVVSDMWDFPIKSVTAAGGKVIIKIAGFSNSISGYDSGGQKEIATINFKGNSTGVINVAFNANESKITKKADGVDILMIPQSTGAYTVTGGNSPTPTPTSTPIATYTPVSIPTTSPIPSSGAGDTVILGLLGGFALIVASVLFAF